MKTYTISGRIPKNSINGNKGHHSRSLHRHLSVGRIKGVDSTNLRPLENAPFHPSFRSDLGIKGRSSDDKIPGNLRSLESTTSLDPMGWAFVTVLGVALVFAMAGRRT